MPEELRADRAAWLGASLLFLQGFLLHDVSKDIVAAALHADGHALQHASNVT